MQQSKAAVVTMVLLAAGLAGFGAWQFGGVGLFAGEREEGGHEHEERVFRRGGGAEGVEGLAGRIAAEYGGRVVEVEREHEDGREVLEVKIIDSEGTRRKLHLDPADLRPIAGEQ